MADGPYGITLFVANNGGSPATLDLQILNDLLGWGGVLAGVWLRYQLQWQSIEVSPRVYNWAVFDDAVAKCNAAGVNMCWNLQSPPSFYLTISATDGSTVTAGTGDLPNATDTATFMAAVAARYSGISGHGFVAALQVGNEDWDTKAPRDLQSQWLAPVFKASYTAIRNTGYTGYIGVCAVRKTPTKALAHIQNWLTNLFTYQGGIGALIANDRKVFFDFHYYRGGSSAGADPTTQDADTPSVATELSTIQGIVGSYTNVPPQVWCGETGWDAWDDGTCTPGYVTQDQQSTYTVSMLEAMRTGGGAKCFVFTLNDKAQVKPLAACGSATVFSTETKNIIQTISGVYTYLPAYSAIQTHQAQHPSWSATPAVIPKQGRLSMSLDNYVYPDATVISNATIALAEGTTTPQALATGTAAIVVPAQNNIPQTVVRCSAAAATTGASLPVGSRNGQLLILLITSAAANTITFATSGTSLVAGGTSVSLAGLAAHAFIWDATGGLWYQVGPLAN